MATAIDATGIEELDRLLRASNWAGAADHYERELGRAEKADPKARLAYAIALARLGKGDKALRILDPEVLSVDHARLDMRRFAISPLAASGEIELASRLLDSIIAEGLGEVEDFRLRGSIRGRLKQWDGAIADAGRVLESRPDEPAAQRAFVQLHLQAGRVEEAGARAAELADPAADPLLANIALLALTRSGRSEQATALALEMADCEVDSETTCAMVVRTLADSGEWEKAIEVGERYVDEGWEHEGLRSSLAQAYLASFRDDRYEKAIAHLREGLAIAPDDLRMILAIGEALLRSRHYSEAIPYLEKACELQPKAPNQRALFARALKQVGRYSEAADQFRILIDLQPSSPRWARYAAGALSQAGRKREAADLFDEFVSARRAALPRDFEQGLQALWDQVDSVDLPRARLDWAWELRNDRTNDRATWERRAKWGHLADHYILDWLECREERIHEAMLRLADLDDAERALGKIDSSRGMILASAHVGPMYAGPLAVELLGLRSKWLASTPTVARTSYSRSLISTSEQDDMDVGKAFMVALRKGFSVVIAVDGAINLAAPRIPFEGQEITYSSFAARTAHRLAVPSVFASPRWEGDRIGFVIRQLPDPEPGESADDHAERWRIAYLDVLREYLGGEPENLRLSGGIWRHIR